MTQVCAVIQYVCCQPLDRDLRACEHIPCDLVHVSPIRSFVPLVVDEPASREERRWRPRLIRAEMARSP